VELHRSLGGSRRAAQHRRDPPIGSTLDLSATIPVGRLIGEGIEWQIAHVVAAALPSLAHPEGRVILSVRPARYQATTVQPIDPGAIG
jgi:hypothetical protein